MRSDRPTSGMLRIAPRDRVQKIPRTQVYHQTTRQFYGTFTTQLVKLILLSSCLRSQTRRSKMRKLRRLRLTEATVLCHSVVSSGPQDQRQLDEMQTARLLQKIPKLAVSRLSRREALTQRRHFGR